MSGSRNRRRSRAGRRPGGRRAREGGTAGGSGPLVSVVIPTHNYAAFLGEALASVQLQNYAALEVIVVDDGSTDGTRELVLAHGSNVRYIAQQHSGPATARNRGVEAARGDLLAFLDADDLWVEGKLACQTRGLESHPEVDMVFGHTEEFFSAELSREERARIRLLPGHQLGLLPGAMVVRRQAFDRAGGFDPRWRVGEFIDWYLRATGLGLTAVMLPDLVLRRRLHRSNLGRRERDARADYAAIVKVALDRRRRSGTGPGGAAVGDRGKG